MQSTKYKMLAWKERSHAFRIYAQKSNMCTEISIFMIIKHDVVGLAQIYEY